MFDADKSSANTLASSIWAPRERNDVRAGSWLPDSPAVGPFTTPLDEDALGFDTSALLRPSAFAAPACRFNDVYQLSERSIGPATSSLSNHLPSYTGGVIGEGRLRTTPPQNQQHIDSLFRALDLKSPVPKYSQPVLDLQFDDYATPDHSPSSDTSSLATPVDISPPNFGLALKLDSSLGLDLNNPPTNPFNTLDSFRDLQHSATIEPSWDHQQQLDPFVVQPRHSPTLHNSTFARSSHLTDTSNGTPARHNVPLFGAFQDHSSTISFGGPLHNTQRSEIPLPRFSRSNFVNEMSSPIVEHRRDLSSSGWATPRPTPGPGRWLGGASPQQVHQRMRTSSLQSTMGGMPPSPSGQAHGQEPINFLSLLHPASNPPYHVFVARIIRSSDQQASIFLQQKLKVADAEERGKIIQAICNRGFEMMSHRFGNWAVQRCLEAATSAEERRVIVSCMRGRVVDLATNCYGCHVLQKALDCEEDIRFLIVQELLQGDPATTLVNKHASHVWSKVMELTWTPPAPPIFSFINRSLRGQWAALACHETGSLVVQHAFENLEDQAKTEIVDEILNRGPRAFAEVVKNQWGAYCIQHILEHGSASHRQMVVDHLIDGLLDFATNEQAFKSITKALKEGGTELHARIVQRMSEPARTARRAMIVDLALTSSGSQLISAVLPNLDKDQRALLYDAIRGHIVTLRGCKTGSKVIWLFDRMRAYYGY